LDLYFRLNANQVPTKERAIIASSFLRGKALNWINSRLQQYLDGDADKEETKLFEEYPTFKASLRKHFGPANEASMAESIIQRLKQTTSAADYTTTFQHYAALTDWNDGAQMSMYKRGLRDNVQDELMRHGGKIDDMDDLTEVAIELDDKLHQRAIEKRGGVGGFTGRSTWGSGPRGGREPWGRDRGDPMELDVMNPQDGGQAERGSPRKCYSCGKPGHIARNCRSKNKVQRSQLNVMEPLPRIDTPTPQLTPTTSDEEMEEALGRLSETNQRATNAVKKLKAETHSSTPVNLVNKTDEQRCYAIDIRNYLHDQQHWTFCYVEYCPAHYGAKQNSTWTPQLPKTLTCVYVYWSNCTDDRCAIHLMNKRHEGYFPGHLEFWYEAFDSGLNASGPYCGQNRITEWDNQDQPLWQRCLKTSCPTHKKDKIRFGVQKITEVLANCSPAREQNSRNYDLYIALPITVGRHQTAALLDTGAVRNFVSSSFVKRAHIKTKNKDEVYELVTANGQQMTTHGITKETVPLRIAMQQHNETITFDVLEMATHDFILGISWLQRHNPTVDWKAKQLRFKNGLLVKAWIPGKSRDGVTDERTRRVCQGMHTMWASNKGRTNQPPAPAAEDEGPSMQEARSFERTDKTLVPHEYRQWQALFDDDKTSGALPKHQPWDHKIPLQEGKQPTFGPIYQLSQKELEELDKNIKENLAKGFIRPSESPAGYPILFVPKKNGKLRLCVDYRKLNDITIKNRYPLPNAKEMRDRLHGAKIFTKLDMRGAYNLIRMAEGEEWKTAFRTRYGSYEYMVMPFGLTNAPASCQELVNRILRDLLDKTVIAYLDDILIYSRDIEKHKQDVKEVLIRLQTANLRLDPEKCEFHESEVEFLGYVVTTEGIRADPAKIKALQEYPKPETVKQVQSFLGTINFNRQFIEGFSKMALPLTEITKKEIGYRWGTPQENAFQQLKQACVSLPVLRTFEPGQPIRIETDASDTAMGACLRQQFDKKWHPIAYYSKKLTDTEQNYDIHDKELLAIVAAFEQWRVYAEGANDIEVLTDHKNLIYFTTSKVLNKRQVRWSELLGQYKFKITYTPGKDNTTADGLSRRPDLCAEKTETRQAVLKETSDGLRPVQQLNALITMEPLKDFLTDVKAAYKHDHLANEWINKQNRHEPLQYNNATYVPEALLPKLISDYHDNPKYGHPGITRTMDLVTRHWSSPKMRTEIEKYIKECPSCQQNRATNHAQYGYLQKIRLPEFPWGSITMDFIVKLPPSLEPSTKEIYDAIMVVVDRHTKYMTFIPFNETYNAEQLGYVFLDKVVRIRGFPQEIISDRDKLFTSAYWKTLNGQLGVKVKLSSAYHPQTDGQTERANRTLKQYLRNYVAWNQSDWVKLLPVAELAINNLVSRATGTTPFFANYGRHPNLMDTPLQHPRSEQALRFANDLEKTHKQVTMALEKGQNQMEIHENKSRKEGPQLEEGMKVWLSTRNLKPKRPNKSLDHKRIGPFKILKVVGPVNYKLQLPEDAKVHHTFHISLLERASDETPLATEFAYEPEEETVYEVEKILQEKNHQYLVKWVDYPNSENTWEPEENLLPNCATLLRKWRQEARTKTPAIPTLASRRRNLQAW